MRIIIEGCDSVGKTTVIEKLCNEYKLDIVKMTGPGWKDFESYFQKALLDNVVHDRSFISEFVYSTIYKRDSVVDKSSFEMLLSLYRKYNTHIIFLTADVDVIMKRLKKRNTDNEQENDIIKRKIAYDLIAKIFSIKIIDTSSLDEEQIFKEVKNYIDKEEASNGGIQLSR